jgi:hypothetical protein
MRFTLQIGFFANGRRAAATVGKRWPLNSGLSATRALYRCDVVYCPNRLQWRLLPKDLL